MSDLDLFKPRKDAADQLWKFFEVHASQRMSHFRFFIIMISIFFAGIGVLSKEDGNHLLLILLSTFFLITTFVFQSLDKRTRELLKLSENYLIEYQAYLSGVLNTPNVKMIELSNKSTTLSYTKSFRVMYVSSYALGIIMLIYFFCQWCNI